jgi:hypothetical protein
LLITLGMLVVVFALSFLMVAQAKAANLTCDPYFASGPGGLPTSFIVTMDSGTPVTVAPKVNSDGSVTLWYDCSALSAGNHTVTVQAANTWGSSPASAPFVFTKPSGTLVIPTNVTVK